MQRLLLDDQHPLSMAMWGKSSPAAAITAPSHLWFPQWTYWCWVAHLLGMWCLCATNHINSDIICQKPCFYLSISHTSVETKRTVNTGSLEALCWPWETSSGALSSMQFTPSGRKGSQDNELMLWDNETQCVWMYTCSFKNVPVYSWSPSLHTNKPFHICHLGGI